MDKESYESGEYVIRWFARAGFVFLSVIIYRLYKVFASPSLKYHNKNFIRLFIGMLIISFTLLISEFIFDNNWLHVITASFNAVITYTLSVYLAKQVAALENRRQSTEYMRYSSALDALIDSFKHPKK